MNRFWTVDRRWEGQTAAVLASGPSMNAETAEACRYHHGLRVIVINNTFQLAPWADLLYAADHTWWQVYRKEVSHFLGLKVSIATVEHPAAIAQMIPDLLFLQYSLKMMSGYDPDPARLCTGGNSGYQAVHLAAHLGVRRILLLGFDMHGKHWHPEHQRPLREMDDDRFMRWIPRFADLGRALSARGIEVVNCTPHSALRCFRASSFERAMEEDLCVRSA